MKKSNGYGYLNGICQQLCASWPENRTVNIVCHGHSVPAGYFASPVVDSIHAYPHLFFLELKKLYPHAVVNVIVTAVGGEHSESGASRFDSEVLGHRPDVVTLDYALNDRQIGLERAYAAWSRMIESCLSKEVRVLLMTPTPDTASEKRKDAPENTLDAHADQVRALAERYGVGLVDSALVFEKVSERQDLSHYMALSNHPNRKGHHLVVNELLKWFCMAGG